MTSEGYQLPKRTQWSCMTLAGRPFKYQRPSEHSLAADLEEIPPQIAQDCTNPGMGQLRSGKSFLSGLPLSLLGLFQHLVALFCPPIPWTQQSLGCVL